MGLTNYRLAKEIDVPAREEAPPWGNLHATAKSDMCQKRLA
jgi:hypothetical protein